MTDEKLIEGLRWQHENATGVTLTEEEIGGVLRMIDATPAVKPAVKVKPLVWCDLHGDGTFYCPRERSNPFDFPAAVTNRGGLGWHYMGTIYKTIEGAKAATQADYEARILSAIETQPAPDVSALVEALKIAANRLHRAAMDFDTGSHNFIETCEWADEARGALEAWEKAK